MIHPLQFLGGGAKMKHRVFLAFAIIAFVSAFPLLAQMPKGWMVHGDHSTNAADPDAPGDAKFMVMGSGFHITSPQAGVYWNPADTATGNYALKGTFKLIKSTGYNEYYGLVFGGSDLQGAQQTYLYFMITDDGTWMVKRRTGASTDAIMDKTPNAAIKKPDGSGMSTNALEVRVTGDKVDFLINGTAVHSMPKTGELAKTDGIYAIRLNHHLEVMVDGFGVSKL
jgi:hypothetical protein